MARGAPVVEGACGDGLEALLLAVPVQFLAVAAGLTLKSEPAGQHVEGEPELSWMLSAVADPLPWGLNLQPGERDADALLRSCRPNLRGRHWRGHRQNHGPDASRLSLPDHASLGSSIASAPLTDASF